MNWIWFSMVSGSTLVSSWDFESGPEGFSSSGIPDVWECGVVRSGPAEGSSGASACGTGLEVNYGNNSESFLSFPDVPLAALSVPMLRWENWYAFETGDAGRLEAFDGGAWQSLEPVYGYPSGDSFSGQNTNWHSVVLDLSSMDNLNDLRLRLSSDTSVTDDGWFIDSVDLWDGDVAPPRISGVTELVDTDDLNGPYSVFATVVDNRLLDSVELFYRIESGPILATEMSALGNDEYVAEIPGQPHDSDISYWIVASDADNEERYPVEGSLDFRVRLPAPVGLSGPEGVVHSARALMTWSPPDTSLSVVAYWLYQADEFLLETLGTEAEVDLLGGGLDRFYVTAIYDAGEGDASAEVLLDSAVPRILEVDPQLVFQGDQIRAELHSENLLFVQDDVQLNFGQGVEVSQVDVRDVDTLIVRLEVAQDAVPGPRVVSVQSGAFSSSMVSAVQVIDGKERPKVSGLNPSVGRQGSDLQLEITTSKALAGVYEVDLGEGILVQEIRQVGESSIVVNAWIEDDAPLGERMVTVDDGERIWAGEFFKVLDRSPAPVGCAAQAATPFSWAASLFVLASIRSRRRKIEK
ncbi:MAG: hypothetical protein VXW32_16355 [Myxococcota bacterium]|nr:hypothetical protein [Myxococcota bacterium]